MRRILSATIALGLAACAAFAPPAFADEGGLITPVGSISVNAIRVMDSEQVASLITQHTGTDASVTVDKEALTRLLETQIRISLPVAASQGSEYAKKESRLTTGVAPFALNDATITYNRPLGSNARTALAVCRNWGVSTCTSGNGHGFLNDGQNTYQKYGWPDSDGYYHPSVSCETRATFGPFSYTFRTIGWVKLSGTGGLSAWLVQMWC